MRDYVNSRKAVLERTGAVVLVGLLASCSQNQNQMSSGSETTQPRINIVERPTEAQSPTLERKLECRYENGLWVIYSK